ncbi:hypothetical protein FRX31_028251 [Thalictrum thalictroides]|uniref:Uncharacterized protein n=1 Tax=Thalictrum thalictroides TaxID=46969 RepID=A0A7J6VBM9_THATH|nr:hypothetical protein FRX31_028251 [Thalictrum thalictroides]
MWNELMAAGHSESFLFSPSGDQTEKANVKLGKLKSMRYSLKKGEVISHICSRKSDTTMCDCTRHYFHCITRVVSCLNG